MMNELKPCPFCGGEAVFVTRSIGHGGGCAIFDFQISCTSCEVKVPESYGCIEFYLDEYGEIKALKDGRPKALEAWNRRASDK